MASAASLTHLKTAKEYRSKAESTLKKYSFFGSATSKYEDAAELYTNAGKMYVMAKNYAEGCDCYEKSAEYYAKTKGEFDAATARVKAAEAAHKMSDFDRCVFDYKMAVNAYAGLGKCAMAAGAAKKCGELLEETANGEKTALSGAVDVYKEAIDFFDAENRPQAANGCREKVAYLSATLGNYDEACAAFEELGKAALQSNLGKFNAKKWFTAAVLCALARDDSVKAGNKLLEFSGLDYSFDSSTRDHQLCSALIDAVDANDADAVAAAASEYDKVKRLDPWMTKILLAIKATLDSGGGGGETAPDDADADDLPDLT